MLKNLKLNKRLRQKRVSVFTSRLFVKVFTAYLTLFLTIALSTASYSQTVTSASRDKVVTEIKQFAKSHVDNDSALKTDFVVKLYENNKVGLTSPEIATIYEEEYTKLKEAKKSDLGEQVKDKLLGGLSWYFAIAFLVLFLFKEALQKWVNARLDTIGSFFYNKFAGSQFFRRAALRHYQHGLMHKYKDLKIPFRQNRPLDIREVYVPLKVTGAKDAEQFDAKSAVNDYHRLMVKGPPGSGKSMLLKHLALSYALNKLDLPDNPIPVLLELHRLSDTQKSIEQHLAEAFERDDFPSSGDFVSQSLEQGTLMLLLDGLDEVNSKDRAGVVLQIKDLLDKYSKCRAVITCRTAVYKGEFNQEVDRTLEVVEFNDQQVRLFLCSWQPDMPPEKSIEQLMQTLHDRPRIMTLARNPLMLTIIAYLYTDTPFVLPHSRAEFYRESTEVLLNQWHQEHNQFKAQHKRLILQHLALHNQDTANQIRQDRRSIDYKRVLSEVSTVLLGLNLQPEKVEEILDEIVERSGLLLQIDGGSKYQFAHLTLQEYFAAAELIDKSDSLVNRFQADPDVWRETIKLWCGLASDSTSVIREVYKKDQITAFECLADAQKVDQVLAQTIIDNFKVQLGGVPDKAPAVEAAFAAVAASERPRGKAVLEFLVQTLATSQESSRRAAAANALSLTNLPTAAQFLAHCYDNCPETRSALIRMGDLAVPALAPNAANGSIKAMDDLVAIGTPDAAKALAPLLWHQDKTIATEAAPRLATLMNKPSMEDVLRDCEPKYEKQKVDWIDWIWQSFSK